MTARRTGSRPRIRHNDYPALDPPQIGDWQPRLSVSVVVPAYCGQSTLDLVLAALAAQSYPGELLEAVVVDDGSNPPLHLPELRPEHTRLIRTEAERFGSAYAVDSGVAAAGGEVILRLDSDILVYREHVEAHLRWHHRADYLVVMGTVWFTPFTEGQLRPQDAHKAVQDGAAGELFSMDTATPSWTAQVIANSDGLVRRGHDAFRVATGATVSCTRTLYHAAGGMDGALRLGGDTEFGYRLAQAGAVFVPEPLARSWHLGLSQMKTRPEEGRRYRAAHLGHLIPLYRNWRAETGRHWRVPYVDVVIDASAGSYEEVSATVAGALASTLPDVAVSLVADWSRLPAQPRAVLDDPWLDLRMLADAFGGDGRVVLREAVAATSAPAPFRFRCPPGVVPRPDALRELTELAGRQRYGLVQLAFPTGRGLAVARLERTAAVARARHLADREAEVDDLIGEMFGSYWLDGTELLVAAGTARARSVPELHAEADRWRSLAEQRADEIDRLREQVARRRSWLARAARWLWPED